MGLGARTGGQWEESFAKTARLLIWVQLETRKRADGINLASNSGTCSSLPINSKLIFFDGGGCFCGTQLIFTHTNCFPIASPPPRKNNNLSIAAALARKLNPF